MAAFLFFTLIRKKMKKILLGLVLLAGCDETHKRDLIFDDINIEPKVLTSKDGSEEWYIKVDPATRTVYCRHFDMIVVPIKPKGEE